MYFFYILELLNLLELLEILNKHRKLKKIYYSFFFFNLVQPRQFFYCRAQNFWERTVVWDVRYDFFNRSREPRNSIFYRRQLNPPLPRS